MVAVEDPPNEGRMLFDKVHVLPFGARGRVGRSNLSAKVCFGGVGHQHSPWWRGCFCLD